MKGMLIKDFRLMKTQKRFFWMLIAMGAVLSFSTNDSSFIIGFILFVMPMFALSTISYDEFDNGNAFLFTLPVSRETYAAEKYVFGLLLGLAALVGVSALSLCIRAAQGMPFSWQALSSVPFFFLTALAMLSFMIPLHFKFGAEKSRIAMLAVGGGVFAIDMGIVKILERMNIDLSALAAAAETVSVGLVIAAAAAAVLLMILISMKISVAILRKKEY